MSCIRNSRTQEALRNEAKATEDPSALHSGQHRTIAATRFAGSYPPILRFEKLEIRTGFLHVSNPDLAKNLSPDLLAGLCGVTLVIRQRPVNLQAGKKLKLQVSFTALSNVCLRRPLLFRLAGKEGGRKGALLLGNRRHVSAQ